MPFRDNDYEGLDDAEFPDLESEEESGSVTVPCPFCRQPLYEGAERCPNCRNYISHEDSPPGPKPWWFLLAALVLLLTLLLTWIF